jgi:hypothetical protein
LARCRDLQEQVGAVMPPISLSPILRVLGADVTYVARAHRPEGQLAVRGNRWNVIVPPRAPWRRARFTIAHEIGHILLFEALAGDDAAVQALLREDAWPQVEALCDVAAAALLLPQATLREAVARGQLDGRTFESLYDEYLVSWHALLRGVADAVDGTVTTWRRHARAPHERRAPRLTRVLGAPEGIFIPTGLTCKHLDPDIVTAAYALDFADAPAVRLEIRDRPVLAGAACASHLPPPRSTPPTLDGMPVPDEPRRAVDVVVVHFHSRGAPATLSHS